MSKLTVYTDGGCNLKDRGVGAWAYLVILPHGQIEECTDGLWGATNNRMEMYAVLKALERLGPGADAKIVCDSEYVIKGLTVWHHGWRERGWRNGKGDPVKNRDLWARLLSLHAEQPQVTFQHVRGHSGDFGNERVDTLCTNTIKQLRAERLAGLPFAFDANGPFAYAA